MGAAKIIHHALANELAEAIRIDWIGHRMLADWIIRLAVIAQHDENMIDARGGTIASSNVRDGSVDVFLSAGPATDSPT